MKTVGEKLGNFAVTGVKPGALSYDDSSFEVLLTSNHFNFRSATPLLLAGILIHFPDRDDSLGREPRNDNSFNLPSTP